MKVIITGGSGLVGSALAASLAGDKHEVIVLSRAPEKHAAGLPAGVRAIAWDGRSAAGWGELASGAGAIVNLAGENLGARRWSDAYKRRIMDSRLGPGRAVVEAVEQAAVKPRVLIQASAVGYYGPRGDQQIVESTPPGSDFQAQVCIAWEQSSEKVEALGVRRAITRMGVVVDRANLAMTRMSLPYRFFAGGPLGSGKQYFSWIHLHDAVAGIRFLIDNPAASGAYNLTAPQPLPNREFGAELGKALHRPSLIPVPAFAIKLLFGEMSTVVLDSLRVIPQRLLDAGFTFRHPDAASALHEEYG